MSIATELDTLRTNLTSAYNTISSKGGTVPTNKNTSNLSTAISSIPQTINSGTNTVSYIAFQMWPGMGKRDNIPSQYQQLEYLELNNYEQYCALTHNGSILSASGVSRHRLLDFIIWLPEYAPIGFDDPNYNLDQAMQYAKDRSAFWLFSPNTNSATDNQGVGFGYKCDRQTIMLIKNTSTSSGYTYQQSQSPSWTNGGSITPTNQPVMRYHRMYMYDVMPALLRLQLDGFYYYSPVAKNISIPQPQSSGNYRISDSKTEYTTPATWIGKKFLAVSSNPSYDQQYDVHCPCRIFNIRTAQDVENAAGQRHLIDFVPVRRISDNKTGFLNVANGWNYFIPSAGTSDFTAGPDLV